VIIADKSYSRDEDEWIHEYPRISTEIADTKSVFWIEPISGVEEIEYRISISSEI
jgi:hypothetical protein